MDPLVIFTVGHSNQPFERLADTLVAAGVRRVVDVRRKPGSRRHPQFDRTALARSLPERGIEYVHLEALGGMREPETNSPNRALRASWARGYADYMATPEFRVALDRLMDMARETRTAILCAEADPASCHRSFIADALSIQGVSVVHLLDPGLSRAHHPHRALRPSPDGVPSYPDDLRLFPEVRASEHGGRVR